jgi:integrase
VDLQLKEGTIKSLAMYARKFLDFLNGDLTNVKVEDIRRFLSTFSKHDPSTYRNVVKALRRLIRDFMGRPDLMESFRMPRKGYRPKRIPSKEEIKAGFNALRTDKQRAIYLLYATTGLRMNELTSLKMEDIDFDKRMITPNTDSRTKRAWVTFYNEEAEGYLKKYLEKHRPNDGRLFHFSSTSVGRMRDVIKERTGIHITPQVLRDWFCSEMGELGVADRYVDAFCGRVPRSVLARHYTDFSPERLKRVYDGAGLKVLS